MENEYKKRSAVFLLWRMHRSTMVQIARIKDVQPWFHGEYRVNLETANSSPQAEVIVANLGASWKTPSELRETVPPLDHPNPE